MTIQAFTTSDEQAASVRRIRQQLESHIPSDLEQLFAAVLDAAANSREVLVSDYSHEVSPQEAANLLGMSRPTVNRLIADGALNSRRVGNRHRIAIPDLISYQKKIARQREKILSDLVAYEQLHGTLD